METYIWAAQTSQNESFLERLAVNIPYGDGHVRLVVRLGQREFQVSTNGPSPLLFAPMVVPYVRVLYSGSLTAYDIPVAAFLQTLASLVHPGDVINLRLTQSHSPLLEGVVGGQSAWSSAFQRNQHPVRSQSTEPNVRLNGNAELVNAITEEDILPENAVYLAPDVQCTARRAYDRRTLQRILERNALNPFTRQPFTTSNIKKFNPALLPRQRSNRGPLPTNHINNLVRTQRAYNQTLQTATTYSPENGNLTTRMATVAGEAQMTAGSSGSQRFASSHRPRRRPRR